MALIGISTRATLKISAAVLAISGLAHSASAILVEQFNYADFNSVAGLHFNGVATQSDGVGLNPKTVSITPPVGAAAGSVYYNNRQPVSQGFSTDFQFRIRDKQGVGSDGLCFIIQNDQTNGIGALGSTGGAIGFSTNLAFPGAGTGISNSVAIVFDCWDNSANWATIPGAAVVTVQTNGLLPNLPSSDKSLGGVPVAGAFNDGNIHNVRITYTPGAMSVYYDNFSTPVLSNIPVNLDTTLALTSGGAFVGFTAATGANVNRERHEILNWKFSAVAVPTPGAAALLGLGGLTACRRRRAR